MISTITSGRLRQRLLPNDDTLDWIEEISLFSGGWQGKKAEMMANWLRWWDSGGNLLLWGNDRVEQERQRAEKAEIALDREKSSSQWLRQKLMNVRTTDSRPELIIEAGRTEKQYWKDLWRYRDLFYFLALQDILFYYKKSLTYQRKSLAPNP